MNDAELRRWAIEQAIAYRASEPIDMARRIIAYVTAGPAAEIDGPPWSNERLDLAIKLRREGIGPSAIMAAVNKLPGAQLTRRGVAEKLYRLGVKSPRPVPPQLKRKTVPFRTAATQGLSRRVG